MTSTELDALVARLRTCADESEQGRNFAGTPQACRQAAAAITSRKREDELREALVLIRDNAKIGLQVQEQGVDQHDALNEANATLHQIAEDARQALSNTEGGV